ncbi:MAG TPA: hypothetical protein VLC09_11780 [Polyangiaceae bacterium]|nr:hypothetical protein [Polyangiaceae bacterium]
MLGLRGEWSKRTGAVWSGWVLLIVATSGACGGSYVEDEGTDATYPDDSASGGLPGSGGRVGVGGAPATGGVPYEEEPCPEVPPPEPYIECDPLDPWNGCDVYEGCYATLEYPTDRCGRPRYVSYCAYAGSGTQGDLCDSDLDCQPGYMCVVGAAAGARCGQLCLSSSPDTKPCPVGLICGETDVPGFGVCF